MTLNNRLWEAFWICFWQWNSKCCTNVTIFNRSWVSDYYHSFMVFFLIAHHLCMALSFIVCRIIKQYWSMGCLSLLTFTFILTLVKYCYMLLLYFICKFNSKFQRSVGWEQFRNTISLWCFRYTFRLVFLLFLAESIGGFFLMICLPSVPLSFVGRNMFE